MAHKWTAQEDLAAFYVCKFGPKRIASSESEVADRLGVAPDSFHMRVGNFKALLGPGGLRKYAKQSEDVYKAHRNTPEPELRALVMGALDARRRG